MPKRLLVDAVHPEQTRVVILKDGRIQEFDSETSIKTQLKGNIYLGKITRVEPSLQAAFVDYGGERHGFLPFSEINADYYHVPVADKEDLKRSLREQQEREMARELELDLQEQDEEDSYEDEGDSGSHTSNDSRGRGRERNGGRHRYRRGNDRHSDDEGNNSGVREILANFFRKYKIQEVIKRGQIVLIQVNKEERGNKGASLTTYITLPGRYCVLMPNTPRQGGVSRRIGSVEDRRRLKTLIDEFKLPEDASIIIRTAGAGKAMSDIRRDYDYLAKIWNNIRELTLSSSAPSFIHGEGNVVEKTLRDLYDDDVDEILIEGDETFARAKEFMEHSMPEHAHHVRHYRNKIPIFARYRVDEQIEELYGSNVALESGGYIVINPTEALISIDVNSGRATGQRSVEETAVKINLEAAYEIARQLRLREFSGLIVVDFIDMLELKNRIMIEQALRDAFYGDRAKVQIGRISPFGLLEMSRQRLGPSFHETNTVKCPHCKGSGSIKATETIAVNMLRSIESHLSRQSAASAWDITTSVESATYLLNYKRTDIATLESRYHTQLFILSDIHAEPSLCMVERRGSNEPAEERGRDESSAAEAFPEGEKDSKPARSREGHREASSPKKERSHAPNDNRNKHAESDKNDDGTGGLLKGLWRKIVE